ncbi:hypothetical protein AVEN_194475-1 [Araneus ventricosus]|uniref:Uncharacterized protein n=1 Tax=Araneus ventricosus TaxID=182803 RepID=A0A4Y2A689_ARAVE|nr:hypothetical protein AVEN_194475-1 [Araneus ventricosus]
MDLYFDPRSDGEDGTLPLPACTILAGGRLIHDVSFSARPRYTVSMHEVSVCLAFSSTRLILGWISHLSLVRWRGRRLGRHSSSQAFTPYQREGVWFMPLELRAPGSDTQADLL